MTVASRRVQRLHLRAPDDTLARRGARLIEDAMRTASLPDGGARMLVFRRFALGRFAAGISPQTLSLALERRVAALRGFAVHAAAPDAAQASVVWFRDALEAHTILAQRVAAGAPAAEWFWPLIVPGIERPAAPPQRLRLVLHALARRPEAAVALPALARALARHAGLLRAAVGPGQAAALLGQHGADASDDVTIIASGDAPAERTPDGVMLAHAANEQPEPTHAVKLPTRDRAARIADAASDAALPDAPVRRAATHSADVRATDTRPAVAEPQAHQVIPLRPRAAPDTPPPRPSAEWHIDEAPQPALRQPVDTTSAEVPVGGGSAQDQPAVALPRASPLPIEPRAAPSSRAERPSHETPVPGSAVRDTGAGEEPRMQRVETPPWPCAAPTQAGGLLFLLPVLARLGYAHWLDAAPEWAPLRIDRRVLALACARLKLPADDPAWRLCTAPAQPAAERFCAPSRWTGGIADCDGAWHRVTADDRTTVCDASGRLLLAAWRGRRRPAAFAPLLYDRHIVSEILDSADPHPIPPPFKGREEQAARASRRSLRRPRRKLFPPPERGRSKVGVTVKPGSAISDSRAEYDGNDLTAAVTAAWLTACRRWLRRYARIGVASLVTRPARLTLTPTHADLFFALSGTSVAVRRTGLDLDPGWVPWFGRVVTFHYGRTPWT